MSGDTSRALDWLLAHPDEAADQQGTLSEDDINTLLYDLEVNDELELYDYSSSNFGSAPSSWLGTQDEYRRAMEVSADAYFR
jgi:hypothetical protein